MNNEHDELASTHAALVEGAKGRPEYRDNTVSAVYGYSEGVEHALETRRLMLSELLREAKEIAWDEGYDEATHEPIYHHNPVNPYRKADS